MQTAICPGSFDPITLGHLDVIRRASKMFERVVVCVVANPGKHCAITLEERCEQVRRVTASIPNVEVDMWGLRRPIRKPRRRARTARAVRL